MNIVFMGTPDFAVPSLQILLEHNYHVSAVVTAPDKPAGRGKKMTQSAVKTFALSRGLKILQPEKLKSNDFVDELKTCNPDIAVVVAFRMLPEKIWRIPVKGTFNLHASLLPQYRGAAPINWAVINGETKTGVTTFFIDEHIDTGTIIMQEEVSIGKDECAGDLHDHLMMKGAGLVLKTVRAIEKGSVKLIKQETLITEGEVLKPAPKLSRDDCRINWTKPASEVNNFIRGLTPYPGAFTTMVKEDKKMQLKIYKTEAVSDDNTYPPGTIVSDDKTYLKIYTSQGFVDVKEIQSEGKKRMDIALFLNGFKGIEGYSMV